MLIKFKKRHLLPAAFVLISAAVFGHAQQPAVNKLNTRPTSAGDSAKSPFDTTTARFSYEFTQPEFYIRHILVEHDARGHGRITFSRLNEETPIVEPLELSAAAAARIATLWDALSFLDSTEVYQTDRQYPHLGTMRLKMEQGTRQRTSEFNYTNHNRAAPLINEYRRVADQAILVFDLSVARESQPLNAPKLMDYLETLLKRNGLSDAKQLIPLLKEISVDEHLPLIARNHASRLLKKIDK